MFAADRASQALGMRLISVAPGECEMRMRVRPDMLNGLASCHGGIIFALADSAFAFACNSEGVPTVSAAAHIDHLAGAGEGDELSATARRLWQGGRSGLYEVVVADQGGRLIALFRGRSHRRNPAPSPQLDTK
ncbi:MAG: hydroxyphenylacetyl-CoA thioesterase PaaI [Gammaproteobacteria bacterium]|nr:hydroxyphenylacetyl-CoA thioesterase PaaI [Gammaproteobacteria bacterium]